MNKLIIPRVTVAVIAVGIGIFYIFQKPIFPEPPTLRTPSNGGDIQRAEEPSPTVSTTPQLKPKLKPSVGAALSKLHVFGNRIVIGAEQAIRLRGVNFEDPFMLENSDMNGDGVPDNHFAEIATDFARVKALGANIVRLPLYPGYYFLVGGEKYLTTYVDLMVDLAEKNGLYVSISYHAIGRPGGWYNVGGDNALEKYPAKVHYSDSDMAVAFWDKVAARYGKRKHVLFEMYNEPADETAPFTWTDWRPTGELLIATIRKHSDNIILGSGIDYTGDLSAVPTNPYSDSNLVYVAHIYPATAWQGDDQVAEWERLFGFLAKTYPVIVSEWGFHDGTKDETVNGTLAGFGKPLLDYLDKKNLSWVAYGYFVPDGEPPMLESDWTTLTEFGEFVKERLQKIAPLRSVTTLKTLAEQRGIRFGAMYQYDLRSDLYDRIFETEMSAMTAGTFWDDGSSKSRTEFDFSEMDAKVKWGRAHSMELHGHVLVWFDETTMVDWVKAAPTADMEAIMNERIDSLVGRYAGQIKVWDVVNEAVNEEGNLRQNHKWAEAMGDDYIRKAFVRAHAADPTAVLRYNDYDIESNEAKYNGVKKLLKNLLSNSVPVHALGWQMHLKPDSFDPATLLARFNEIADMGLDNYITELDVELPSEPTTADYEKQKQTYKSVINVFLSARRHKTIVIWGLRDGDPYWLTNNHPLPFDKNHKKKPAYDGIQEALFGL